MSIGWNFFESCHGKGAVDSVGATVKRLANDAVRQGADIDTPRKWCDGSVADISSLDVH